MATVLQLAGKHGTGLTESRLLDFANFAAFNAITTLLPQ
jgi:hypothetical protein